jgi:hypothetical protein
MNFDRINQLQNKNLKASSSTDKLANWLGGLFIPSTGLALAHQLLTHYFNLPTHTPEVLGTLAAHFWTALKVAHKAQYLHDRAEKIKKIRSKVASDLNRDKTKIGEDVEVPFELPNYEHKFNSLNRNI